ncbi:MAG: TSUP family transporter [Eubacteriales bacterium]|nr:TSUP family transporter [Eubacteriales bacterium]
MTSFVLPLLIGFGTGILSAWGVGGGTLLLLCMTLFLGVDQSTAQGINLLYFLPTAGMGLIWHKKNGLLEKNVLRQAIPLGTVAAVAAAWIATSVDTAVFRKPFGIYLLMTGVMTLFQTKKSNE